MTKRKARNPRLVPQSMKEYVCVRLNIPALKRHKKFGAWLNHQNTNCFTWHKKGCDIGEYSDVAVWVDVNGEGSDSDMPRDVWNALITHMGGRSGLCWITFVG